MDAEGFELEQVRAALDRRDATTVGRAYAVELRRRLDDIAAWERSQRASELPAEGPLAEWLRVVWDGCDRSTDEPIDPDLWLDLVVAAADELCDESALRCLGDGPADHLVGEHPAMAARLHAARATHPGVAAMFRTMIDDARDLGYPDAGWWSDPSVAPG